MILNFSSWLHLLSNEIKGLLRHTLNGVRNQTQGFVHAWQVLSQLSYTPSPYAWAFKYFVPCFVPQCLEDIQYLVAESPNIEGHNWSFCYTLFLSLGKGQWA